MSNARPSVKESLLMLEALAATLLKEEVRERSTAHSRGVTAGLLSAMAILSGKPLHEVRNRMIREILEDVDDE